MNKKKWKELVICVILTAIAFVGITGLFYTDYRPLNEFSLVVFFAAWAGLIYTFIRNKKKRDQ